MTKRAAEETPLSFERSRTGADFLGYYRAQLEEFLSHEERMILNNGDTDKSCTDIIGVELSDHKKEKLNALLRQCVWDSVPEIDEIQSRVLQMHLLYQLSNKKQFLSPSNAESVVPEDPTLEEEEEDDLQLLMKSDPELVKAIVSKYSNDLLTKVNDMQQEIEKILDNVASTCSLINRSMSRGEKRDLKKSIKELPKENLKRVAGIIKNHYIALGKDMPDEVLVNMDEEDNILLWRLHYCVAAIKSAKKLASS